MTGDIRGDVTTQTPGRDDDRRDRILPTPERRDLPGTDPRITDPRTDDPNSPRNRDPGRDAPTNPGAPRTTPGEPRPSTNPR